VIDLCSVDEIESHCRVAQKPSNSPVLEGLIICKCQQFASSEKNTIYASTQHHNYE